MLTLDPTLDYLVFDFLRSVDYYNVTGDKTWDGPHTLNNCWMPDSLPTYDGTEVYYRRASLNIPLAEWFDPTIQVQRQDYIIIVENQHANTVTVGTTRKYFIDQADFDERLQIWRLQIFTQDQ
jgi:hypothetical protein